MTRAWKPPITDLPLFAQPRTRRSDPITSRIAEHEHAGAHESQCERVYGVVAECGGGILASQIAERCGIEPYVVRKRTADLANAGRLYARVFEGEREQRWFPGSKP